MIQIHGGKSDYVTAVGSDVARDGFYIELCESTAQGPKLVAEAFWSDATGEFSVTLAQSEVPFSVLEAFIAEARERVPPVRSADLASGA